MYSICMPIPPHLEKMYGIIIAVNTKRNEEKGIPRAKAAALAKKIAEKYVQDRSKKKLGNKI